MSSKFYTSIIEDEIKAFNVKEESLKQAAKCVSNSYSIQSLDEGQTFLDYNISSNRCAYIFKYAKIHTRLVTKYFNLLIKQKEVKSCLRLKKTLKICCLGGGPGTDVVGLFKVLAMFSQYHKKVVEVTVLDICGGWRNSFNRIMKNLIGGKINGVPETFVNTSDFKCKLIAVNLLDNLPSNIVTIISEADIVCMVKFVSAILGISTSVSALQVIGEKLKIGAIVLFIDNFRGKIFKPLLDISGKIALQVVLGPLHEVFKEKTAKGQLTSNQKKMFGCHSLSGTSVSVLGFLKSDKVCNNNISQIFGKVSPREVAIANNDYNQDDEDSWDTEDESENCTKEPSKSLVEYKIKIRHDKFTQTSKKHFSECSSTTIVGDSCSVTKKELSSLLDHLCDLSNALSLLKQRMKNDCHCHH